MTLGRFVGKPSVGAYGTWRRESHAATFGRSDVGDILLRLEEHAFYVVLIKLTASVALTNPERLSSEKRQQAGTLLSHCPSALKRCVKLFAKDKLSLSPGAAVDLVLDYVVRICELPVPLLANQVPPAPELSKGKGMRRDEKAALLM